MVNMSALYSLFLLLATFELSSSFLDDRSQCEVALADAHSGCSSFFNDIRGLDTSLASLLRTVNTLQRDIDLLSVRLVNGTAYSGTVELFQNGYWGAICDQHWDQKDADVVCKMLGYNKSWSVQTGHVTSSAYFTSNMNCTGLEESIFKCSRMNSYLNYGCDYNRAAGVDCVMGVRLVGSTRSDRGRVEVQHHGEWGSVCDMTWTSSDAAVVCKMLGMRGGRAVPFATFGAGTGRILLSNILCKGNESHLMQCSHTAFRIHSCDHSADVSVICDP